MRSRVRATIDGMNDSLMLSFLRLDEFRPVEIGHLKNSEQLTDQEMEDRETYEKMLSRIAEADKPSAEHGAKFLIIHNVNRR